jgi:hypothetical protein
MIERIYQLAGPRCAGGAITSACAALCRRSRAGVLTAPRIAQLAFRGGRRCGDRVVTVSLAKADTHAAVRQTRSAPLGGATPGEDLVAASGPDLCVATASPASSAFGTFIARRQVVVSSRAPGGRLIALVALGSGACAALIAETHHPTTVVAQASIQQRRATLDTVPGSVQALGMFRCHAHLVVLGARRDGRQTAGAVVPITVRRGPKAALSTAAVSPATASRCH